MQAGTLQTIIRNALRQVTAIETRLDAVTLVKLTKKNAPLSIIREHLLAAMTETSKLEKQ